MNYLDQTRQIVCDTLLVEEIDPQLDLFEAGLMDSLALVNLIMNIEDSFDITVPVDQLHIDDYRTVYSISGLVKRLSNHNMRTQHG
ncbi:MAG: phosphopantetheine-binding protein [Bacteroidota bacterium]